MVRDSEKRKSVVPGSSKWWEAQKSEIKLFQDQVNYKSLWKAKLKLLYFAFLDISLLVSGTPTLCSSLLDPGTTPLCYSLLVPGTTGLLRFFRYLPPYLFQQQLLFAPPYLSQEQPPSPAPYLFQEQLLYFTFLDISLLTCSRHNFPLLSLLVPGTTHFPLFSQTLTLNPEPLPWTLTLTPDPWSLIPIP